jgi:hypothetical protein
MISALLDGLKVQSELTIQYLLGRISLFWPSSRSDLSALACHALDGVQKTPIA